MSHITREAEWEEEERKKNTFEYGYNLAKEKKSNTESLINKYTHIIKKLDDQIEKSEQHDRDMEYSGAWGYNTDSMYSTKALKEKRQIYVEFVNDLKGDNYGKV